MSDRIDPPGPVYVISPQDLPRVTALLEELDSLPGAIPGGGIAVLIVDAVDVAGLQ